MYKRKFLFLASIFFLSAGGVLARDLAWDNPFNVSTTYFQQSGEQTDSGGSDAGGLKGWFSGDKVHAKTRKTMISAHQIAGALTWGLWLATNVEGERALKNLRPDMDLPAYALYASDPSQNLPIFMALKYDNPGYIALTNNQSYMQQYIPLYYLLRENSEWSAGAAGDRHRNLAMATTSAYAITATLALLAPSRSREFDRGIDSVFFHKGLALLHFAAIAAMPSLGEKIEHEGRSGASGMQTAGWAGFSALSVAIVTVYW